MIRPARGSRGFPGGRKLSSSRTYQITERPNLAILVPASLMDAYEYIRKECYTARRLEIERLSGKGLPMEQCYINLALVEQAGGGGGSAAETPKRASELSLLARLKVERPAKGLEIDLRDIFEPRKARDEKELHPRRIFIRGRAGVGKTTLCKKAVHDFIYRGTWSNWFDSLLWIPLRKLPELGLRSGRYNLTELFRNEFFSQCPQEDDFASTLRAACDRPDGGRTLFILDGLDEIWHDRSDSGMSDFVRHLLSQPNIIVMSRPSVTPPREVRKFDLELETVGFSPQQVVVYVEKMEPKNANAIRSFLDSHPLVRDLVRIPIQLDALCYAWGDVHNGWKDISEGSPETMTGLYRAIEGALWKKDVIRLKQRDEANHLPNLHMTEVDRMVEDEKYLLEGLAFTGLLNDVIVFDARFRDAVSKSFARDGLTIDKTLQKLSFLRAPDHSKMGELSGSCHFLHLTLQEFFAARYFVRAWRGDKAKVTCLHLQRHINEKEEEPGSFFQKYKYSARYDIVWRFVVGLLSSEGDAEGNILGFFNAIDTAPLDLLGPTHQRLSMHCLSEISPSINSAAVISLKERLERRLSEWLKFQVRTQHGAHGGDTLAGDVEFPVQALINIAQQKDKLWTGNYQGPQSGVLTWTLEMASRHLGKAVAHVEHDWVKRVAFSALCDKRNLSEKVLNAVAACLDHPDPGVRRTAVDTLGKQTILSGTLLEAIAARVRHQDPDVRCAAVGVLGSQSNLSEKVLAAIEGCINHQDPALRCAAVNALKRQSNVPEKLLEALAGRIDHPDPDIRRAAVDTLGRRAVLSKKLLEALAGRIDHPDPDVKRAAVDILGSQSNLPEKLLEAIAGCIDDHDPGVRRAAVDALKRQSHLPEKVLAAIAGFIDHYDPDVKRAAVDILGRQSNLPEKLVEVIAGRIDCQGPGVRLAALGILSCQSSLSEKVLEAIAACLDDQDMFVGLAAVGILGSQSSLSEKLLKAIAARLDDQGRWVKWTAVSILGRQSNLSETLLERIAPCLDDQDRWVRWTAVDALKRQSNLPEKLLEAIAGRIGHPDPAVRRAEVVILGSQSNLSETQLEACLDDQDPGVRQAAVDILGSQSNLSEKVLAAIEGCINHQDPALRRAAVDALKRQSKLPEKLLEAIAGRIGHQDPDVGLAAVDVLKRQSSLSEKVLAEMGARIRHQDPDVGRAAVDALGRLSNLSEKVLEAIAGRLDDQSVRWTAVDALKRQSNLPEKLLEAIAGRIDHHDPHVRRDTISILGSQSNLSGTLLERIAPCLDDQDPGVRRAAVDILSSQSNLSEKLLEAIAGRIDYQRPLVKRKPVSAFDRPSNSVVELLAKLLAKLLVKLLDAIFEPAHRQDIRWAAVGILGRHSNLPETLLEAIAARIRHQDPDVRCAAVGVLGSQSNLSKTLLKATEAFLDDQDPGVRRAAVDALGRLSKLPEIPSRRMSVALISSITDEVMYSMLIQNDEFHRACLHYRTIHRLFQVLLERSFRTHLSWCIGDGESRLETQNGAHSVVLVKHKDLSSLVRDQQKKLGLPPVATM
jgi:HEAT repeat protein